MTVTDMRLRPAELFERLGAQTYVEATKRGVTLSRLLEEEDPTSAYGSEQPESKLDAFQRMLKHLEIRAEPDVEAGIPASTWNDLTKTPQHRAVAYEWAMRQYRKVASRQYNPLIESLPIQQRATLLTSTDYALNTLLNQYVNNYTPRAKRLVPSVSLAAMIADTQTIPGRDYRALYIVDDFGTDAYRMKRVNEGAEIPATTLVSAEHTTRLHKYGRALRGTYEQLQWETLNRIAFIIARMALQAEVDKVAIALDTIVNGDGNSNTAAAVLNLTALDAAASAGTLTYKGYVVAKIRFGAGYIPDSVIGQEATVTQLMMLPVGTLGTAPLATVPANAFGGIRLMNPTLQDGLQVGISADAPALKLIFFDSGQVLERVQSVGGTVQESTKFINDQTTLMTFTEYEGYNILDANAARVLNVNA